MFKTGKPLFLYAETSVHLGSGQSLGAIDLTIQRERFTELPMGAASGMKGVIRDAFERKEGEGDSRVIAAFGPDTSDASAHAGAVAFTDLRLLLFPIRSMKGVFAWATCPMVLQRFQRDVRTADPGFTLPAISVEAQRAAVSPNTSLATNNKVFLEEYEFTTSPDAKVKEIAEYLAKNVLPSAPEYDFWRQELPKRLVILPDDEFRFFTKHATEVQARIKLNSKKTTTDDGGNLFYQENLPAESVLYSLVLAQNDLSGKLQQAGTAEQLLDFLQTGLNKMKYLQIGGDESTGRGIVRVRI